MTSNIEYDVFEDKKEAYQMGYWQGVRDIHLLVLQLSLTGFTKIEEEVHEAIKSTGALIYRSISGNARIAKELSKTCEQRSECMVDESK
jgi:hypothetical protein